MINIINEYNPAFNKLGKIKIFSKTIVLWRQKKNQLVCVLIRVEVDLLFKHNHFDLQGFKS